MITERKTYHGYQNCPSYHGIKLALTNFSGKKILLEDYEKNLFFFVLHRKVKSFTSIIYLWPWSKSVSRNQLAV